jgi:hypothetical protein
MPPRSERERVGTNKPLARAVRVLLASFALGAVLLFADAAQAQLPEVAGNVGFELRGFPYDSLVGVPSQVTVSGVIRPEFEWEWADGDQQLRFIPFFRIDSADDERTHFDIRELIWITRGGMWEVAAGIGHVFWGVTESQHLVDIINQTDLVENPDGEDKLGQPMVNLTLLLDWGAINLFVLPGFRERTFSGVDGRFRPPQPVDTNGAIYESGAENGHVDFAARWSHYVGDWDFGVAHFHGTGRDPTLVPLGVVPLLEAGADLGAVLGAGGEAAEDTALVPYYSIIDQTSVDLTAAKGDILWKLEVINRFGQGDRYAALTGGLEYTIVGAFGTTWDVGVLGEYLWDERGETALTAFEDDIFIATRFAFNDTQSTDLLAGLIIDRETGSSLINIESHRRIGERFTVEVEARFFVGAEPQGRLFFFQDDDYLSLEFSRFF